MTNPKDQFAEVSKKVDQFREATKKVMTDAEMLAKIANPALYSSKTVEWETPKEVFAKYAVQYKLNLDVCATAENAKCANYFTKEQDGLNQNWSGRRCWMNPPYGREIAKWVKKAYEEANKGAIVVCLLPARTDTRWWHDYCMKGNIEFIKGRLRFGSAKENAPFPSAIVIFGDLHDR